jgi:hypothetical protein
LQPLSTGPVTLHKHFKSLAREVLCLHFKKRGRIFAPIWRGREQMKIFRQLVAVAVIVIAISAGGQSPAPDFAQTPAPAASQNVTSVDATPSPSATVSVEPPSLVPPNILPGPGGGGLPQIPAGPDLQKLNEVFKQTTLGKVADEYRLHLQMAALEAKIRNDTDLHEARASADRAPTDLERRHRFKAYYKLYYKKLIALASTPELQAYLRAHQAAQESSLLQPRVRHNPDETEAAALAKIAGDANNATKLPTPIQARANDAIRNP